MQKQCSLMQKTTLRCKMFPPFSLEVAAENQKGPAENRRGQLFHDQELILNLSD